MWPEHLAISGRTAVLAIIGDPIAQVRAPLMINAALMERGRAPDAVMVPMQVSAAGRRLIGTMFDGEGFVAGLRLAGHEVTGKRVLLLGAGGAAAGIAFALGKYGASSLTIRNRTRTAAAGLGERVQQAWPQLVVTAHAAPPYDMIVNATSLGMKPGDALPVDPDLLRPPVLAVDIIVHPEVTPFLARAAQVGCQTHPGKPMLAAQMSLMLDFLGF
jgi:shikimate dehydrogenase